MIPSLKYVQKTSDIEFNPQSVAVENKWGQWQEDLMLHSDYIINLLSIYCVQAILL